MSKLKLKTSRTTPALLAVLLLILCVPIQVKAQLTPSPFVGQGPFFPPDAEMPMDNDLTLADGCETLASGEIIEVRGTIQNTEGELVPNAEVLIWQTDDQGNYDHPDAAEMMGKETLELDPCFQYWGKTVTDQNGNYFFKTIIPEPYLIDDLERPAHIHFRVRHEDYKYLTMELHFPDDPFLENDRITAHLDDEDHVQLMARITEPYEGVGSMIAAFNIVLEGKQETEGIAQQIDALMSAYHERSSFEGAILVAQADSVLYQRGFGLANREWQIPNAPDVAYDVGSLTKTFTAIIILMLVEQGLLSLDEKIIAYLPGYRYDTGSKVTIHHLLSHTSGIPPYWSREFVREHGRNEFDKEYFTKTFCSGDLEFEPGTKANYSDANYYILGRIIERVAGKDYSKVLEEKLFKPLGMSNSGYYNHNRIIAKKASGYIRSGADFWNGAFNNRENTDAAGASFTTVEDLFLFDQALYGNQLLSSKYRELLFNAYAPSNLGGRSGMSFSYGWQVGQMETGDPKQTLSVATAGGNNEGFTAVIYRLPEHRHFVAILTNMGPGYFNEQVHKINADIMSILYDQTPELPKQSIAKELASILSSSGIEEARELYQQLRNNSDYEIQEGAMNRLGYELMSQSKFQEAIFVFELNVDAFPDSFNVYDSLGEAYMASGDVKLAIKYYKKSLELNGNNENAKRMLDGLNGN